MLLCGLRAPNGRFVQVDVSNSRLQATATAVGPAQEFLIENRTRPEADTPRPGDEVVLRSAALNRVWRVSATSADIRRDPRGDHPVAALRRLSDWDDPFVVTASEWGPTSYRIQLAVRIKAPVLAAGGAAPGPGVVDPFFLYDDHAIGSDGEAVVVRPDAPAWFELQPRSVKVMLRSPSGAYVRQRDRRFTIEAGPPGPECVLAVAPAGSPLSRRLYDGDLVAVAGATHGYLQGARGDLVQAEALDFGDPVIFGLSRSDGEGEVRHGDEVRLMEVRFFSRERRRYLAVRGDRLVISRVAEEEATRLFVELYADLDTYWFEATDHVLVGAHHGGPARDGYDRVRPEGRVAMGPLPGTIPLKTFYRSTARRHFTTATEAGEEAATPDGAVYGFQRVEGYAWADGQVGTAPLRTYFYPTTNDFFGAATVASEREALRSGYDFRWTEAHVLEPPVVPPVGGDSAGSPPGDGPSDEDGLPRPFEGIDPRDLTQPRGDLPLGTRIRDPGVVPRGGRRIRALVLSGGGAKGCFEVGAVRELWRREGPPDIICGVSVGALNAIKLAEGLPTSANELEELWLDNVSRPSAIFREEHYLDIASKLVDRMGGRAVDSALAGLFSMLGGASILGPAGSALGGGLGVIAGVEASDLDDSVVRLTNVLLNLGHAIHSMEPLRRLVADVLDVDMREKLSRSPVLLRVGITDMQTGQYFSVGNPWPDWTGDMSAYGPVEVELDHQLGDNWLTRPLYGLPGYVMKLERAVYASSTLPVFMEPLVVDLGECDTVRAPSGDQYARLHPSLPPGIARLLGQTGLGAPSRDAEGRLTWPVTLDDLSFDTVERALDSILTEFPIPTPELVARRERHARDGIRGVAGNRQWLFDGGLRDTMPIRTALRLGATDITVITGDQLQRAQYRYSDSSRAPSDGPFAVLSGATWDGVNMGATPLAQHLMGLLGVWFNEASRSDMLLGVAMNELRGWLSRASAGLDATTRRRLQEDFESYWDEQSPRMLEALGAGTWLGGRHFRDWGASVGKPPATIRLIAPDRDVIGPLEFENVSGVREGIELGARAARQPVVLSRGPS